MAQHKHANLISEWIKDTSITVEVKNSEGDWKKMLFPSWLESHEYRILPKIDHASVKSSLTESELLEIIGAVPVICDSRVGYRKIANAAAQRQYEEMVMIRTKNQKEEGKNDGTA